jgi:hypothetical protein
VQGFIGPGSSAAASPAPASPDDLVAALTADAAKPQRVAAAPVPIPAPSVSLTGDGRNPAPDSGFALTAQDREIP